LIDEPSIPSSSVPKALLNGAPVHLAAADSKSPVDKTKVLDAMQKSLAVMSIVSLNPIAIATRSHSVMAKHSPAYKAFVNTYYENFVDGVKGIPLLAKVSDKIKDPNEMAGLKKLLQKPGVKAGLVGAGLVGAGLVGAAALSEWKFDWISNLLDSSPELEGSDSAVSSQDLVPPSGLETDSGVNNASPLSLNEAAALPEGVVMFGEPAVACNVIEVPNEIPGASISGEIKKMYPDIGYAEWMAKVEEVAKLNNIPEPYIIHPGDNLHIPVNESAAHTSKIAMSMN
jgi:hypothetical protein